MSKCGKWEYIMRTLPMTFWEWMNVWKWNEETQNGLWFPFKKKILWLGYRVTLLGHSFITGSSFILSLTSSSCKQRPAGSRIPSPFNFQAAPSSKLHSFQAGFQFQMLLLAFQEKVKRREARSLEEKAKMGWSDGSWASSSSSTGLLYRK